MATPTVSIICFAYNHEKYIRQALDGFVCQKTDFPFEIIIHDDASTDQTASIIKEYEKNHPKLFKPIYQTVNQYSLETGRVTKICYTAAKGKYISLCEADDYWIDPYKLQKQVDFLEENESCSYVFSNCSVHKSSGEISKNKLELKKVFDLSYLLKRNIMPGTATVMFKNNFEKIINLLNIVMTGSFNGDWVFLFILTHDSKIGFIDDFTATYRQGVGVVSNTTVIHKMKNGLETNKKLNEITNFKYNRYLQDYRFNYSEIAYHFAREKKIFAFLKWFFKIEFHLISFHGFTSIFRNWNKRFIKNSLNIFLNRAK